MKKQSLFLFVVILILASCNDAETSNDTTITDTTVSETPPPVKVNGDTTEIYITANDQMRFDQKEIKVQEGQTIKLTLDNVGKLSKQAMGHNFVLLQKGADYNEFANKAAAATGSDYIPQGEAKNIIAHTRLLGGGEKDEIVFKAPSVGTYEYLCSFPGHAVMMHGSMIVEKK